MSIRNNDTRKSFQGLIPLIRSSIRRVPKRRDTFLSDESTKRKLIEVYSSQTEKLQNQQIEYKKLVLKSQLSSETGKGGRAKEINTRTRIALRNQKNDLKAQIWVANGVTHRHKTANQLKCIKASITCQEEFLSEIYKLRTSIRNLEREISIQDKRILTLSPVVLSNRRHVKAVAEAHKKLQMFENHLEMKIGRECYFTSDNLKLRKELTELINERTRFYKLYTKLMQQLTSDKKYLFDIIEYAKRMYENCIETYDKMEHLHKRAQRDDKRIKAELLDHGHKLISHYRHRDFIQLKLKRRSMHDIEPREIRRREKQIQSNLKKYSLYKNVLQKLYRFTKQNQLQELIDRYKEQESLYYSYFSYANEMGYHMTLLNTSLNSLHQNIRVIRQDIRSTQKSQISMILNLEKNLAEKRAKNDRLKAKCDQVENHIETLFQDIAYLFERTNMDVAPIMLLLSDKVQIDMPSMRGFLKKLETRLLDIVAVIYCLERIEYKANDSMDFFEGRLSTQKGLLSRTVKGIERVCEWKTALSDIVLAEQCPECAEGEAFLAAEDESLVIQPLTSVEVQQQLHEKVMQPEMQYRLHRLSDCRMPRSRYLSAKRSYANID